MRVVATAAALMFLLHINPVSARNESSLTDFESGTTGAGTNVSEPEPNTIASLREKLILSEATTRNLSEALAAANMELEVFKRHLTEANLRLEALGLAYESSDDTNPLEARLLQAIRELRILKENQKKATEQLLLLSETIHVLLKSSEQINPQARLSVETELRKTTELLAPHGTNNHKNKSSTLQNAQVLETRDDLSLLIIDVGTQHGAKLGMPLRIFKNGNSVGEAKIVEVRERISGAVIQNLTNDSMKVTIGDQLKVDIQ